MIDQLKQLYVDSGFWAQPILLSTVILMIAGSIMMFTVRLIKRFVFFCIIAALLPNAFGLIGYIERTGNLKEAIVERGEEISGGLKKPLEDIEFSPMYLGLVGSALTLVLGVAGIARAHSKNRQHEKENKAGAK